MNKLHHQWSEVVIYSKSWDMQLTFYSAGLTTDKIVSLHYISSTRERAAQVALYMDAL